jgi:hypothetical protein
MPNPHIEQIAARFPGPVTLYPSRKKWSVIFLGCALFALGGIWMISRGEQTGWFVLIVFGLFTGHCRCDAAAARRLAHARYQWFPGDHSIPAMARALAGRDRIQGRSDSAVDAAPRSL